MQLFTVLKTTVQQDKVFLKRKGKKALLIKANHIGVALFKFEDFLFWYFYRIIFFIEILGLPWIPNICHIIFFFNYLYLARHKVWAYIRNHFYGIIKSIFFCLNDNALKE